MQHDVGLRDIDSNDCGEWLCSEELEEDFVPHEQRTTEKFEINKVLIERLNYLESENDTLRKRAQHLEEALLRWTQRAS